MTDHHTGSCLCGEVRFVIEGPLEQFLLCHCSRCRKDTGSAHAANLFSSSSALTWVSGEAVVKTFNRPGTLHQTSFCSVCGSALPDVQMDGGLLVVPAGSLDSRIEMRPTAHICCSSRAEWDRDLETISQIDDLPS